MNLSPRSLLFCCCLVLFLVASVGSSRAAESEVRGTVSWIYDGDTLKVEGLGKVRLIGIDTPERDDSERDRVFLRRGIDRRRLRQIANEALQFNIRTVKNQTVRLRFEGERRDRHGRLLAYVVLPDGQLLNRLLLEQGYALVYRRFDFSLKEAFLRSEDQAQGRGVGLWQGPELRESPSARP